MTARSAENSETAAPPSSALPEGFVNRGIMIYGEAPGTGMVGGAETEEARARRERRNARDRQRRARAREALGEERIDREAEVADEAGELALEGTATGAGNIRYYDSRTPNVTIHGPTYEAPTYYNNPVNINNPDQNVTIGGGEGGGRGNGGGGANRRSGDDDDRPNRDPARNPDQLPDDDGERQRLQERLDELQRQMEELNRQLDELRQQNEELRQQNEQLQHDNEELRNRVHELENPPGPTPEEMETARNNLESARDELAELDIRRSARITDRFTGRRREDAANYESALTRYREAMEECARLIIAHERAEGTADDQIHQALIQLRYGESETYVNRVVEINDDRIDHMEGTRGRIARGLRRWANVPTRYKIGLGILLGAGVSAASVLSGGGLALLVAGGALRFSYGLVNHEASIRNVSHHSRDRQLEAIHRAQTQASGAGGGGSIDARGWRIAQETEDERRANTRENMRRNRRGAALMVGGGVLAALGIAHAAGADVIPDGGWLDFFGHHANSHPGPGITHNTPGAEAHTHGGFPVEHTRGGPGFPGPQSIDMTHFHPDKFYATTPHEAVRGMLGVIGRNHIKIHGADHHAIAAIARDMEAHHWHLASGMEQGPGHLQQNIVDVGKDWADGHTQNFDASAEQGLRVVNGSSTENWRKVMELMARHGVTFTQEG